ncbi:hypothetical protein AMATHDRAFT_67872 [Amanita thiersii Skay4041]|uniref:DUF6535 domain-containing protein n=1 Tax=Amanita thiersii Skay4041 TaxID=703135 RepID=A0A2A9NI00_9AGAR|nr:hypothetical protein AMATHDRAFT_67872 [Amanita thiersii Skay4041]
MESSTSTFSHDFHMPRPFVRTGSVFHQDRPRKFQLTKERDNWEHCLKLVQEYDRDMCQAWKEEIDKLLIFAGLFSAAVTAFASESYKWLQEDQSTTTNQLLAQLVMQMQTNTTINIANTSSFSPSGSAVRTNVFWYLSLTLSLATVLIGILCLQWLREYERSDPAATPQKALALRQMRYEGLIAWKVPSILATLPILLQLSLVLFFAGLLDFLWTLNRAVSIAVTIVVGLLLLFTFSTTLLPAIQSLFPGDMNLKVPQCPYKSPQSWLLYQLIPVLPQRQVVEKFAESSWRDYDNYWLTKRDEAARPPISQKSVSRTKSTDDTLEALLWVHTRFAQSRDAMQTVYFCIKDLPISDVAELVSRRFLSSDPEYQPVAFLFHDQNPAQLVDMMSTMFLMTYRSCHHSIKNHAVETYIHHLYRISDRRSLCINFPSWSQGIMPELQVQLFEAVASALTRNVLPTSHVTEALHLIGEYISGAEEVEDTSMLYPLAAQVFRAVGNWISQPYSDPGLSRYHELQRRLHASMLGLEHVAYLPRSKRNTQGTVVPKRASVFMYELEVSKDIKMQFWPHFVGIVRLINKYVQGGGDLAKGFLRGKAYSLDSWSRILTVADEVDALLDSQS